MIGPPQISKNQPQGRPFPKGRSGNPGGRPRRTEEKAETQSRPQGERMIARAWGAVGRQVPLAGLFIIVSADPVAPRHRPNRLYQGASGAQCLGRVRVVCAMGGRPRLAHRPSVCSTVAAGHRRVRPASGCRASARGSGFTMREGVVANYPVARRSPSGSARGALAASARPAVRRDGIAKLS